MIFIVLWITIFALVAIYLLQSPKVRGWLTIIMRAKRLWRVVLCAVGILVAILVAYKMTPRQEETFSDAQRILNDYSIQVVRKVDSTGKMQIDPSCILEHPRTELTYVMPIILNSYEAIVEKPTIPVLVRMDDTLQMELRGYKQFKNRGIRLSKLLQSKLGKRFRVAVNVGESSTHTLQVVYTGTPWNIEQIMTLPVMEAAHQYRLEPALLMSLIRHVSNFDFNFKGPMGTHGLLAMGGYDRKNFTKGSQDVDGLQQIFAGAERLSKQLQVLSKENAIATFYPEQVMDYPDANWTKSPLIKSWVDQVIADVEFYRTNGLKNFE